MYKMVISRMTAEGESTQVEVNAKTGQELQQKLVEAGKAIDARLYVQNMRILAVHTRMKTLDHDARTTVHEIFQLLNGRRLPRPGEIAMNVVAGMAEPDPAVDEIDKQNGGNPYSPHPGLDSVTQHQSGQVA